MKSQLTFDLDEPQDRLAHRRCINATNAYLVLHNFSEDLRNLEKHSGQRVIGIDEIRDIFYSTLEKYDINLNDLE